MNLHIDKGQHYTLLTPPEKYSRLVKIKQFLRHYADIVGINYNDIVCRKEILLDIIEKVEKRRVYFHVFHSINMSEQNEISLYCFWVLKLCPFFNKSKPGHQINVAITFFTFLEMAHRVCLKTQKRMNPVSRKYAKDLIYAFQNRDISKEAIMLIAETIVLLGAVREL